ncbi:hypothetical protein [Levilactobacillus brevis]|uniref:hypothetical protein n=1 Tax=Levilactobacillus brevis TaxID=1580 RepID=UPI001CDB1049|nr:hypothetical protein [Levilactobacillus brevis]
MKKMMQLATVLGIGAGILGLSSVPASANSQYSAKRANSVRLVWRTSMKRHAYTATQGARYSKHLGIRYSNNDVTPTVTWYTDAHEKLYKKYQGHSTIYYHVKSADGTLQGWIWRGYLKPVPKSAASKATPAYVKTEATQSQKITNFFPGVKTDNRLTKLVQDFVVANDDGENYQENWEFCVKNNGFSPKEAQQIHLISSMDGSVGGESLTNAYKAGRLTLKDYFSKIAMSEGAPIISKGDDYSRSVPVTYTQFKGWHIGVATVTPDDTRNLEIGYPIIYVALMPGK